MRAGISKATLYMSWILFLVLLSSGCGSSDGGNGGAGSPPPSATGSGQVALLFTDGPTDEYAEINMTVTRVELLGGGPKITIFEGSETLNLLALENFSDYFSLALEVPAGSYNKIRLILSDLELVKRGADGVVIETVHPKLPGNGKLDLNPRGSFVVQPDATLIVQIDMDAEKSIHIVKTGNDKVKFRPVVFVDIITDNVSKLVRVHGDVAEIDYDNRTFLLCRNRATSATAPHRCVATSISDDTSLFDSSGDPAVFDILSEGDEATAIGYIRSNETQAEGQPHRHLTLHAEVIEIGEEGAFARPSGITRSAPGNTFGQFNLEVHEAGNLAAGALMRIQLQEGTKIFSKQGEKYDSTAIVPNLEATADGVLVASTTGAPDLLKSALIVLDMHANAASTLSGEIGTIDIDGGSFVLLTSEGDRCVTTTPETGIVVVVESEDGFTNTPIAFEELAMSMNVDVTGHEGVDGCFVAETIVAY